MPRTAAALADDVARLCAALPPPARVLVDGVGSTALADDVAGRLVGAGRPPVRVSADDFLRPAGERFEQGREDAEGFRTRWLDTQALHREVLAAAAGGRYLPALRDAARDRSARRPTCPLPDRAVLLVDGVLLLSRGLPAELVVHLAVSGPALLRRGVPAWQVEAFADYERLADPRTQCDVLVLADDPVRPALVVRSRHDQPGRHPS